MTGDTSETQHVGCRCCQTTGASFNLLPFLWLRMFRRAECYLEKWAERWCECVSVCVRVCAKRTDFITEDSNNGTVCYLLHHVFHQLSKDIPANYKSCFQLRFEKKKRVHLVEMVLFYFILFNFYFLFLLFLEGHNDLRVFGFSFCPNFVCYI